MTESTRLILVVDDDRNVAEAHRQLLLELGYDTLTCSSPLDAERFFDRHPEIALVLTDLRMPNLNGLELLQRVKLIRPDVGVILATVVNDIDSAVRATKAGAYNYLLKPLRKERLSEVLSSFFSNQPLSISADRRFSSVITRSRAFEDIFRRIQSFAEVDVPVLIEGETGTGKELVARLLHTLTQRSAEPFIPVDIASLNPQLFDAELFGYRKGALSAEGPRLPGFVEAAGAGTLFLDEIGELGNEQQKTVLRMIESKRYAPTGEQDDRPLEARIVTATNRDLPVQLSSGNFRSDLYYRLAAHRIKLPPLRERPEDIELLASYFLRKHSSQFERVLEGFTDEALDLLRAYSYPGNVRELEGIISAAVLLEESPRVQADTLPHSVRLGKQVSSASDLEKVRYQVIMNTLAEFDGNQTRAAAKLGIARGTLNRLLRQYRNQSD